MANSAEKKRKFTISGVRKGNWNDIYPKIVLPPGSEYETNGLPGIETSLEFLKKLLFKKIFIGV